LQATPAVEPVVSVVVPAHNAASWITEALESVLAQTYAAWELIVVDDGSSDDTPALAGEVAARDPRVRLIRQRNRGVAAARNAGITASAGRYIAPLDADDFWFPDKLALQVAALEAAGPEAGLAYCWSAHVDERSRLTGGTIAGREEGDAFGALFLGNFIGNASTPLMRREALDAVGLNDTMFFARGAQGCEDRDLYLRIAERFRVVLVPRVLVGYRVTPGSMSASHRTMLRSHRLLFAKVRARRPDLPGELFRWANAFYDFYLERTAARSGRPLAALGLLARAAWQEPVVLGLRQYWHLVRLRCAAAARRVLGGSGHPRRHVVDGTLTPAMLEARVANQPGATGGLALLRRRRAAAARRLARPERGSG